jgi:predicted metalloprotease with PDZ domain
MKQTLEASSFDAWTKFYKQDENAPNAIVSYYAKGALFALLLDLYIRLHTGGAKSLDAVMRHLWQQYGKPGIGLPEGAFEQLAAEVSGLDLQALFDRGVRSTDELQLTELLRQFGVEMYLLPAQSQADKGRVVDTQPEAAAARPVLGANVATQNNEVTLLQVFDGGAAQIAGLSAGDVLVAVDGLRMDEKQLEEYIADTPADTPVKIHLFRRDELLLFDLIPQPAPANTCVFHLPQQLDEAQRQRHDAWLDGDATQA